MMARASYKKHFVKSYLRQIFITCFTIKGSLQKNVPRTRSAVAVVQTAFDSSSDPVSLGS